MERGVYRYTFEPSVPMREVRDSLFLAALAAEGIHGRTRVMMDASFRLDEEGRSCVIDGTREVDQSIAVIFTGFLRKEFGERAFTVERVDGANVKVGDPPPDNAEGQAVTRLKAGNATGPGELLDRQILPALQEKLPAVFPDFGFTPTATGWKATNDETTRRLFGVRAERVQAYRNTPFGLKIHGARFVTFVSLEHDGGKSSPRGKDYVEVVKRLAARIGVDASVLDREPSPEEAKRLEERRRRQELLETFVNQAGADLAANTPEAGSARGYLVKRRGFKSDDLEPLEFGLYTTAEDVGRRLTDTEFTLVELSSSGVTRDGRWEKRVLIPWRDEWGNIGTIVVRDVTGTAEAKYLYLPGGHKPRFFGLQAARRSVAGRRNTIVVEGILDALLLQSLGFLNVVGIGGAGGQLNAERYGLLARLGIASVTLALDFDPRPEECERHGRPYCCECSAGVQGTLAALDNLAKAPSAPTVYVVDPGELFRAACEPRDEHGGPAKVDPDELVRTRGLDAFMEVLRTAVPGPVYRGRAILSNVTPESSHLQKQEAVLAVAGYMEHAFRGEWSRVHEDELIRVASERTGWDPESLEPVFRAAEERGRREALERGVDEAISSASAARAEKTDALEVARDLRTSLSTIEARTLDTPPPFSVERLDRESREMAAGKVSGWKTLDDLGMRFNPGELTIIAGRTGHAKTTALVCLLENWLEGAERECPDHLLALYSLEEPEVRVYHRLLAGLTAKAGVGWSVNEVRDFLRDRDSRSSWPDPRALDAARERLRSWESRLLVVHRPAWTIDEMDAHARNLAETRNVGAVLVDYLQRIPPPEGRFDRRDIEVSIIARRLKALAVDTGVPVIAGAQINRQAVGSVKVPNGDYLDQKVQKALRSLRPKLHHLREGGSEQEADTVLGLLNYRADFETDADGELKDERFSVPDVTRLDVGILKNRYGTPGRWAALAFEGRYHLIRDPEAEEL